MKKIFHFFDKLEDHTRSGLSRHPFIYSIIGGVGVVLFWRGVWHIADVFERIGGFYGLMFSPLGSAVTGFLILIFTGLLVSIFIGDSIIMSGINREKKVIEKTDEEIDDESKVLRHIERKIDRIEHKINRP